MEPLPGADPPAFRQLSVYDGRDRIGMLVDRGNTVDAFDRDGFHLGTFAKRKTASDAVSRTRVPIEGRGGDR